MTLAIGLFVIAALLIAALGGYALYLWRRVWRNERLQAEARTQQQTALAEDLRILASCLLEEQVPLIEGAIRIKVLLDNYDVALGQHPRCQVFQQLFEATEQVPTHAAWKALDKPSSCSTRPRLDVRPVGCSTKLCQNPATRPDRPIFFAARPLICQYHPLPSSLRSL